MIAQSRQTQCAKLRVTTIAECCGPEVFNICLAKDRWQIEIEQILQDAVRCRSLCCIFKS